MQMKVCLRFIVVRPQSQEIKSPDDLRKKADPIFRAEKASFPGL